MRRSRLFRSPPSRPTRAPDAARRGAVAAWASLARAVAFATASIAPAAFAAESALPPAPATRVSDEAGVMSAAGREAVERRLERFEEEQGTQIVVAILRRLPPDEALEDWTARVAQAWRVGRAGQDDGAVLFVFVDDRRVRLEVGYGLEGALTDLESRVILEQELVPRLQQGDWDGAVSATVEAIVTAVRGEYQADPRRARPLARDGRRLSGLEILILLILVVFVLQAMARANRRGRRRSGGWGGGPFGGFGGGGFSGGGFGGGGFSGGGFSGGGGSFGGGGASGRW